MRGLRPMILGRCHQMLLLLLQGLVVQLAKAQCECGYYMNGTGDYFTHAIYNNFSTFEPSKTLTSNPNFTHNWIVQDYGLGSVGLATPLPIWNAKENVYIDDGNLVLKQVGYQKESVTAGLNVSVASMASRLSDIYHGSFRAEAKVKGATGGSVGAFFWYHDDDNEIDIELLTREFTDDSMPVHYTVHPAKDESGSIVQNATDIVSLNGTKPSTKFHRHRFDWTSDELRFYQGSEQVLSKTKRIPTSGGRVLLNLWADGGLWSGSPSTTDVLMSIRLIAIYHNTSASEAGSDEKFNKKCAEAGGPSEQTVCLDTRIENGDPVPSSVAVTTMPSSLRTLSLLNAVLGFMLIA